MLALAIALTPYAKTVNVMVVFGGGTDVWGQMSSHDAFWWLLTVRRFVPRTVPPT